MSLKALITIVFVIGLIFQGCSLSLQSERQAQLRETLVISESLSSVAAEALSLIVIGTEYSRTFNSRALKQWQVVDSRLEASLKKLDTFELDNFDIQRFHRNLAEARQLLLELSTVQTSQAITLKTSQLVSSIQGIAIDAGVANQTSTRETLSRLEKSETHIYYMLSSIFALFFIIILFVIYRTTRPIKVLQSHMQKIGDGQLTSVVPQTGLTEFKQLAQGMNDMRQNLINTTVSKERLEKEVVQRSKAEEKALLLVDELKHTQQQLVVMEKMSTLGTLVGGIVHEINNPLMGVMSYVSYCHDNTNTPKIKNILQKTTAELERLQRITKQLLIFTHIDIKASYKSISPILSVESVLTLLNPQIKQENIEIINQISSDTPNLWFDKDKLDQIMINLIINAKDALKDTEHKKIWITYSETVDTLSLMINDNGCGIDEALRYKIFDPFFTTKRSGQGTGMGLSISSQLISDAGGKLSVSNNEDGGASFNITLRKRSLQEDNLTA